MFKKRMKYPRHVYLIDSENTVNFEALLLEGITCEDRVVIFMSENSKPIKGKSLHELLKTNCEIITEFVEVGEQNALDFQLVVYLTKSCLENFNTKHFVLSNDKGFEKSISYINKRNIGFARLVEDAKTEPKIESKVEPVVVVKKQPTKLEQILIKRGLNENARNFVKKALSSETKLEKYHNRLVKHFGGDGSEIYRLTKECFNEKEAF